MSRSQVREKLLGVTTYSQELGLYLWKVEDRFKWFLASVLFAKRISARTAMATFREFESAGLTGPEAILTAGWDRLVEILDAGGYVRYDFSTASTLLEAMDKLLNTYGSLEELHARATDSRDLENKLQQLKGVGPVAVSIFLRELRSIWSKASPRPSSLSLVVAHKLGMAASDLQLPGLESALVRVHLDFCKKQKCVECPVQEECFQPVSTQ